MKLVCIKENDYAKYLQYILESLQFLRHGCSCGGEATPTIYVITHSYSQVKADIVNEQFASGFIMAEDLSNLPDMRIVPIHPYKGYP